VELLTAPTPLTVDWERVAREVLAPPAYERLRAEAGSSLEGWRGVFKDALYGLAAKLVVADAMKDGTLDVEALMPLLRREKT
jgi:hypothetical protein